MDPSTLSFRSSSRYLTVLQNASSGSALNGAAFLTSSSRAPASIDSRSIRYPATWWARTSSEFA